ncbi:LCP family protein [Ornithinibacillus halophilus]|uniref:Transcriptional attenuator, LytR family n=1 Tax=Ornithinibacillus halophilus TaxID=930117 RepID=A0A1M5E8A9_9BACI|nr:LCP family protein [Ornithinibacillus halophilus]SHF75493.1 transcriptional attenuator, LytR family [Ornithinibacillus halophilus]
MSRKKLTNKKKLLINGSIFIAILLLIGGIYVSNLYTKTKNIVNESHEKLERDEDKSNLRAEKVDPLQDNVSVLFLGVDTSEHRNYGEKSRTDAIILATFNKQKSSVKLLSIPRDTLVYVPEVGYNTKINHAHFHGGPDATVETVEEFLNVPVDYFVRMNFEAFVQVVDALGGIMFDVPYEIVESNSQDQKNTIHLLPGYQELDGEEALALARTRKYDSDVDRGKRQQEIIKAIAGKATSMGSVFKLGNVIEAIGDNMKTNLSFDDMKSFLSYGLAEDISLETIQLEGKGGYIQGGWYYIIDEESQLQVQKELRTHLNLSPTANPQLTIN